MELIQLFEVLQRKRLRDPEEEGILCPDAFRLGLKNQLFSMSPACWPALQISDLPTITTE